MDINQQEKNSNKEERITLYLLALLGILILITSYNLFAINTSHPLPTWQAVKAIPLIENKPLPIIGIDVTPKGIPEIYGKELGISYDDVSAADQQKAEATIAKLGAFDKRITLEGALQERYIAIASQISCEYCCGVPAIIDEQGNLACGCSHSWFNQHKLKGSVRTSFSFYNTEEEAQKFIQGVKSMKKFLR